MPPFAVTPLHPSLGAEISGLDLTQPIEPAAQAALGKALAEHLVLVFRDQRFTPAQYLAAAQWFGAPMRQHYGQHNMPAYPDIGLVWHRDGQRPAEMWHTDHTNRLLPPKATLLYGAEVPTVGGDTSVANMRAAYAALPQEERERLAGLTTVNRLDEGRTDVRDEDRAKYDTPVVHPMVRTHPEHDSRAVYFHITKSRVSGMTSEQSRAYMQELLDRMIRPEIVYRHRWRKGDLWVCDNRATMHRAHGDYDRSESRVLWRIIVEGDRPVLV
jgi:taurine dioxygenase